jgi:hypothetical protein
VTSIGKALEHAERNGRGKRVSSAEQISLRAKSRKAV